MSDIERRALVKNSLIAGGVRAEHIADDVLDAIFADCTPGTKQKRANARIIKNGKTGRMMKGTIATSFLMILGIADQAQAAGNAFDKRGGYTSCANMLRHVKNAFRGNGGGACGINCRELQRGEQYAEECAHDLGASVNDAGMGGTLSVKPLQALSDNYKSLVVQCKSRCRNAKSAGDPGSDK